MIQPPTKTRRGNLPGGGQPFTGLAYLPPETKRAILDFDPSFELHTWSGLLFAYRTIGVGGSPSEDLLVYQFTLRENPGHALLGLLQRSDQWKKYGDGQRATNAMLKIYDEQDLHKEEVYNKKMQDAHEAARSEYSKMFRGLKHVRMS